MQRKRVLVTGATGMIGRSVVPALLQAGHLVRVLVRHPERAPWARNPDVEIVPGDMTDAESLLRACAGIDTVVHLAAAKNDEPESEAINVGGAQNLRDACEKNLVRHIVNISTQSVKLPRKGLYGKTKEEADRMLQSSSIPVTTLVCSVVYGDVAEGIFGSILHFSTLPVLPVIGPGTPRYRPLHRDDLARIIVEAIDNDAARGKTYDIGGPDLLSFDQLADKILQTRGITRRHAHIPLWIASLLARAFSILRKPIITASNVLGAAVDVPMDMAPFEKNFHSRPRSLQEGLNDITETGDDSRLEAAALLRYVLPMKWTPSDAVIDRYLAALDRHGIARTPMLDASVRNSNTLLGAVDSATRYDPSTPLRHKLLIAAAVAETMPESAALLLPKDRPWIAVVAIAAMAVFEAAVKKILALPLFFLPGFLARNAGRN